MIDLRSDTVTRPSDAMRETAYDAAVGDDDVDAALAAVERAV